MYDAERTLDEGLETGTPTARGGRGAAGLLAAGSLATPRGVRRWRRIEGSRHAADRARVRRARGPDQEGEKEGRLNVVGEPPDWANEGPLGTSSRRSTGSR